MLLPEYVFFWDAVIAMRNVINIPSLLQNHVILYPGPQGRTPGVAGLVWFFNEKEAWVDGPRL